MKRKWKRTLSILLSFAMVFSMTGMNTVYALEGGPPVDASGLCEHHTAHTDECGYTEGTPEVPCAHEHRSECYKEVTECVHEHTDDCYPAEDSVSDNDATPSDAEEKEPTECTHMCSEESGCITKELDCQHEHDGDCGYVAAVPGTPCTFVCEECAKDSGEQNPPPADNALVQTITGFAGFDGSAPLDTIEVTEKTTVAAIGLPGTLAVTLDGADGEAAIPVTWECADDYKNTEYETYDFTPVLGAGYALAEGLGKNDLPYITVNIVTAANKNLRTAGAVTGLLKLGGTVVVSDLTQDGGDTIVGGVVWKWDAEAATLTLTGNGSIGGSSNDIVFSAIGDVTVEVNGTVSASALTYRNEKAGTLTLTGSGILTLSNEGMSVIEVPAGLTISGLTVNASTTGEYSNAISVGLGSFTMTSGKLTATATGALTSGIYASENIAISGAAEVTASGVSYGLSASGDINISGGTVEAASTGDQAGIRTGNGVLNISGGSVTAKSAGGELAIDALGGVTVDRATLVTGENGNGGGIRENLTVSHTDADVTVNGHISQEYSFGTEGNLTVSAGTAKVTGDVSGNVTVSGGAVTVGGTVGGFTNHTGGTLNGNNAPTQITFAAEQTGGVSGTADSTGIVLTFSQEVTGLTKNAIKCSTREGTAVIDGEPAGSGKVWTVPISVDTEGLVNVGVDLFGDFNVTNNPQFVTVYKASGGGSDTTHTINFGSSTGGTLTATVDGVAISTDASVAQGKSVVFTAAPNSDYRIKEWKDNNSTVNGTNTTYTIAAIAEAHTVSVKFEQIPTYLVTVNSGTGGGSYAEGATVTITADADPTGQRFKEWTVNSGGVTLANPQAQSTTFTMPANAVEVTATYEALPVDTYSITVQNDGKGTASANVNSAQQGAAITLTATASSGYRFKEWQVVSGGVTIANNSFTMPAENVVVKAIFEDIPATKYALTVTNGTGGGSYAEGATVTITANPAPSGQRFKEWTVNSGGVTLANASSATTTFIMPANAVEVTATYEALPVNTYSITVQNDGNGTASANVNSAQQGATITLTATASSGYRFKEWQVVSDGVNIANNSFTMPAANVTVKAIFERIPTTTHTITFNANGGSVTTASAATGADGRLSNLPTPTRSGSYRFDGWFTAASGGTQITTATVFTADQTVYAHWTYTGGGSSGGGSGGGGGGSSSGGGTTTVTPPDPGKPDTAINAETKVTPMVNANGSATVTVSDKSVTDAIKAAQDAAKKAGTEKNGVSVTIDATTTGGASDITATLTEQSVDALIKAGVSKVQIKSDAATISLDLTALKAAQATAGGAITLSAKPVAASTLPAAAQNAIGNRPVFSFTLQSGGKPVSNFGGGSAAIAIPYTPQKGEDTGKLCVVYVDDNGGVTYLTDSSYDPDTKTMIARTGHFSVYGVGYKADAPMFADITNHWAKADIDFVAARGLLSGTGNNQFSPDTGMTRGMFVTALGRLAGIDPTQYKNTKFTDVAATAYYAPYVNWAEEKGIVSGTTATTFAPDTNISREQMAVIMANYALACGYTIPKTREAVIFADTSSIGSWAKDAVKAMQMAGVLNSKDGNRFDSQGTATRAEVSAVLHRYVELVIDPATAQGWTQNDAGQWLYYENGKPITGWKQVDGKWYYLDTAGLMQSGGWKQIGGKWYYLYADGSMAVSTKIDGYEVGPDGAWKES